VSGSFFPTAGASIARFHVAANSRAIDGMEEEDVPVTEQEVKDALKQAQTSPSKVTANEALQLSALVGWVTHAVTA
jgi:hypothetical protein